MSCRAVVAREGVAVGAVGAADGAAGAAAVVYIKADENEKKGAATLDGRRATRERTSETEQ